MSKNQVFKGQEPALSLPVPALSRSGQPTKVGSIVGVLETDRTETVSGVNYGGVGHPAGYAAVAVDGTYSLPCSDAVSAPGTPVYITGSGPWTSVTTTSTSNTLLGYTVDVVDKGVASGGSKSSGAGNVNVKIARV